MDGHGAGPALQSIPSKDAINHSVTTQSQLHAVCSQSNLSFSCESSLCLMVESVCTICTALAFQEASSPASGPGDDRGAYRGRVLECQEGEESARKVREVEGR